ncbi:MAG: serine/threonine-protein kinase, partial [Planctomycetota bacterium]
MRNRHALKLKPDRDPGTRPDERAVPPTSEIEARLSGAHDLLREIDGDSQPEDRTRIDRQHTRCEPTAMPRPRPATDDLRVLRASLLADSSTSDSSTDDFRIGDFQILEELGRGGMGVVYHAIQSSLGRHVALKLLSDSYGSSSRAQERFEREARAAALLQHPNIAAVYGSGSVDGVDYIVMQYIKGKTLDRVIRDRAAARFQQHDDPPLNHVHADGSSKDDQSAIDDGSNEDLIASYDGNFSSLNSDSLRDHWTFLADLGRQAASALHHAHQQGIVHRDIKPSNLMLQEEGLLWVTDFGLAKSTQQDDLTETGEWVGTMRYVSPEQFRGDAEPRSDLFSLGITLYELATLRPAYRDVDPARLTQRILTGDVPSLLRACPEIPRDLATIVDKCIRTEPKDRYESAEALREDFQRFLNHQPIRARQISPFERLGKWVRRQPAIATLLATLFLTLILGVLVASYQWRETASALELARQRAIAAEESEQVATEHLQQARKTVSDFLGRIAQRRLISIPGMEQLRHDLLKDALEYHREFVDRYQDDDRLQSELAESLYYISDLEGQLSGSVDLKDSESLRQAMDIFERPQKGRFQEVLR